MAGIVGGVCDSEGEQACQSPDATQNVGKMGETNWGLPASIWCFFACLAAPAGEGAITM
jgi:hypothetical protein